jgi:hypothetical protein
MIIKRISTFLVFLSGFVACRPSAEKMSIAYGMDLRITDQELMSTLTSKREEGSLFVKGYDLYTHTEDLGIMPDDKANAYFSGVKWRVSPREHNDTVIAVVFVSSELKNYASAMQFLENRLTDRYHTPVQKDSLHILWQDDELQITLKKGSYQNIALEYMDIKRDTERFSKANSHSLRFNEEGDSWDGAHGDKFRNTPLSRRLNGAVE